MARFRAEEAERYGSSGGSGKFFQLKNDGDTAQVRFLYESLDDVEGHSVHEIKDDNQKKHYVNCLREYKDPIDVCPFCQAGMAVKAKLFVPLYDVDAGCTKTWERGKKFFNKISSLCSRYPSLVSHTFEIERNGEAGDQQTTYEIYETGQDDTTLEDLPEAASIGALVWDKTADDMQYYLQEGYFPPTDEEEPEGRPARRRNGTSNSSNTRRTPASGNRSNRRGDAF